MATIIQYKTTDNNICQLSDTWQFEYTNSYDTTTNIGTITFEGDITQIPIGGFNTPSPNLLWIDIPSGITSIGNLAFRSQDELSGITFHSYQAPTIGSNVFGFVGSGVITRPIDGQGYSGIETELSNWSVSGSTAIYNFTCNSSKSLNSGQTSGYMSATTNIPNPTITSSDAWLSVSWNGSQIVFGCSVNTRSTRTASVSVSYNNYTYKTISVSQAEGTITYYFNCDSSKSLNSGATDGYISATTNIPNPTITSSDAWLSVSWDGSQINLSCSVNTGSTRTASVSVSYNSQVYKTISVSQDEGAVIQTTTFYYESTDGNIVTPYSGLIVISNTYDSTNKGILVVNKITEIPYRAFMNCRTLTKITIPSGITSIGNESFQNCYKLINAILPNTLQIIGNYAFRLCSELININIPNGITSISEGTFQDCSSLVNIELPNTITNIYKYAFRFCYDLVNINIPSGVTTINEGTFDTCTSLVNINIPNGITSIGQEAFDNCTSLTNINLPNTITSIGNYAFSNCNNLISINLPSGITRIGDSVFAYCYNLANISIPSSVTSIGNYAFRYCYGLVNINIPSGVTTINEGAFDTCNNLSSITSYNLTAPSLYNNSFSGVSSAGTLYIYSTASGYNNWIGTYLPSTWNLNYLDSPYFNFPYSATTQPSGTSEWNPFTVTGCTTNITSGLQFLTSESMGCIYSYQNNSLWLEIARNRSSEVKHMTVDVYYNSVLLNTLHIYQQGAPYYFSLGSRYAQVTSATTSYSVTGCTTNVTSDLTITPSSNWLSATYDYSGTLSISIQPNTTEDTREGNIVISKSGLILDTFYLDQSGSGDYQITFSPSSPHTSPISGETLVITVTYKNTSVLRVNDFVLNSGGGITPTSWLVGQSGSNAIGVYNFTIDANTQVTKRDSNIVFSFVSNGGIPYERTYYISQLSNTYASPIWQDTEIRLVDSSVTYSIYVDGNNIYDGRGFRFPNADYTIINISKIVIPQLENNLPNNFYAISGSTYQHDKAFKKFIVKDYYTSSTIGEFSFLYTYDYEPWNGTDKVLSEPINGHLDSRMQLFFTKYKNNSGNILIEID